MEYTIVQEYENGTLVEISINGEPHQTFVVCQEGELDEAVTSFVESVKNPKQFIAQQPVFASTDDLLKALQDLKTELDATKAEVQALKGAR
jgi:hypothetical protein